MSSCNEFALLHDFFFFFFVQLLVFIVVWGQNPERKVTLNILGTSWQPVSI